MGHFVGGNKKGSGLWVVGSCGSSCCSCSCCSSSGRNQKFQPPSNPNSNPNPNASPNPNPNPQPSQPPQAAQPNSARMQASPPASLCTVPFPCTTTFYDHPRCETEQDFFDGFSSTPPAFPVASPQTSPLSHVNIKEVHTCTTPALRSLSLTLPESMNIDERPRTP